MTKCANCDNDALYIYSLNEEVSTLFCATHVPGFLRAQKNAGLLPTVNDFEARKQAVLDSLGEGTNVLSETIEAPAEKPAPKKTAKKKPSIEDIVEETVIEEETVVEEPVAEDIEQD